MNDSTNKQALFYETYEKLKNNNSNDTSLIMWFFNNYPSNFDEWLDCYENYPDIKDYYIFREHFEFLFEKEKIIGIDKIANKLFKLAITCNKTTDGIAYYKNASFYLLRNYPKISCEQLHKFSEEEQKKIMEFIFHFLSPFKEVPDYYDPLKKECPDIYKLIHDTIHEHYKKITGQ